MLPGVPPPDAKLRVFFLLKNRFNGLLSTELEPVLFVTGPLPEIIRARLNQLDNTRSKSSPIFQQVNMDITVPRFDVKSNQCDYEIAAYNIDVGKGIGLFAAGRSGFSRRSA